MLAIVLLVPGLAQEAVSAETGALTTEPPAPAQADDPPLNTLDTLSRGVVLSQAQCDAFETAVWVNVEGRGFCVRYWISTAGGTKDAALVYLHGDIGFRERGKIYLTDDANLSTAGRQQRNAERWSRIYDGPFIFIGRVGAYGSSGDHLLQRRMLLEVRVVMAALDALKERHGFKRFDAVGQSGGGHTVAAMLEMRSDLQCAVMASGILSVKTHALDLGRPINVKIAASYDPIDFIDAIQSRSGQRIFVVSDPDDSRVPYHSQHEFVERARAKGLPILHVTAAASGEYSHELASEGLRLATDCARGTDDAALIKRYRTKASPN